MFILLISGIVLNFVSIFVDWIVIKSRWWSLVMAIFTFCAALATTAGAVIATVMFVIFKNVITSEADINIGGMSSRAFSSGRRTDYCYSDSWNANVRFYVARSRLQPYWMVSPDRDVLLLCFTSGCADWSPEGGGGCLR